MTEKHSSTQLAYRNISANLKRYYRMPSVKTSLTVVLSIFIVAFFIFVAMRPTFVTIAELNKTIEASRQTLKQLENKTASLEKMNQVWEQVQSKEIYVDNNIPSDGPRYGELAKVMEVLAYETGVELTSETVGGALTYSNISDPYSGMNREVISMPFSIRVTGGYLAISKFLERLGSIERLVTLDNLTFTRNTRSSNSTGELTFNISGQVHYLADKTILNPILKLDGGK